ncbi:hypothetical protein C7M84_007258 [Penaeus vannamei]|uniref:Uncharacterized protein n=1 Tax=Penaeus vannamei TaxID=6689 RepID=A0A3R7R0C5_PENVA|nr:hypothetical protein C7M84_007258 [Penaeus vannamei]
MKSRISEHFCKYVAKKLLRGDRVIPQALLMATCSWNSRSFPLFTYSLLATYSCISLSLFMLSFISSSSSSSYPSLYSSFFLSIIILLLSLFSLHLFISSLIPVSLFFSSFSISFFPLPSPLLFLSFPSYILPFFSFPLFLFLFSDFYVPHLLFSLSPVSSSFPILSFSSLPFLPLLCLLFLFNILLLLSPFLLPSLFSPHFLQFLFFIIVLRLSSLSSFPLSPLPFYYRPFSSQHFFSFLCLVFLFYYRPSPLLPFSLSIVPSSFLLPSFSSPPFLPLLPSFSPPFSLSHLSPLPFYYRPSPLLPFSLSFLLPSFFPPFLPFHCLLFLFYHRPSPLLPSPFPFYYRPSLLPFSLSIVSSSFFILLLLLSSPSPSPLLRSLHNSPQAGCQHLHAFSRPTRRDGKYHTIKTPQRTWGSHSYHISLLFAVLTSFLASFLTSGLSSVVTSVLISTTCLPVSLTDLGLLSAEEMISELPIPSRGAGNGTLGKSSERTRKKHIIDKFQ